MLTLNRFHTLIWCFYHWLWTSKGRLREASRGACSKTTTKPGCGIKFSSFFDTKTSNLYDIVLKLILSTLNYFGSVFTEALNTSSAIKKLTWFCLLLINMSKPSLLSPPASVKICWASLTSKSVSYSPW